MASLVIQMLVKTFILPMGFTALTGGFLLARCFSLMGVAQLSLQKTWKVYFAASCYGLVAVTVLGFFLLVGRTDFWQALVAQLIIASCIHLIVILLWLKQYSPRALVAQVVAVVFTNLATLAVISPTLAG